MTGSEGMTVTERAAQLRREARQRIEEARRPVELDCDTADLAHLLRMISARLHRAADRDVALGWSDEPERSYAHRAKAYADQLTASGARLSFPADYGTWPDGTPIHAQRPDPDELALRQALDDEADRARYDITEDDPR